MRLVGLNVLVEPYDHLAPKYEKAASIASIPSIHSKFSEEEQSCRPSTSNSTSSIASTPSKKKKKKDERTTSLAHAEEGRQRVNAMRQLTEMEEFDDELQNMDDNKLEPNRTSSSGFKARLVRRIIENLQIEIDGVNFEMRGSGCVAGIVLDQFSVVTTDQVGNRTFVDRSKDPNNVSKSFMYKVLKLEGLGIYCNEESSYTTPMRGKFFYKPLQVKKNEGREYILSPLSFKAKLRQSDCIKCIDFPKYLLHTELPTVSIRLSRTQLELCRGHS